MTKETFKMPGVREYPFSAAIRAGDYIFVSGQGGFQDPETGDLINGIETQTRQCLENIKQILAMAGASLDDVVKVTIFLQNIDDYSKMNEVYQSYFPEKLPVRTTAGVGLLIPNMLVEMDCVAYRRSK